MFALNTDVIPQTVSLPGYFTLHCLLREYSFFTLYIFTNMPTPENAISNSIDILGWHHTIVDGGRRKNSARYRNWRSEVEEKIKAKGWLWRKDWGKQYDPFLLECVGLPDFPVSAASTIRRNPPTDDTKSSYRALNELMLDCFKKVRESQNKRKRAAAQEDIETGRADRLDVADPAPKIPTFGAGRPVVIYILDPGDPSHRPSGRWHWNLPGVKKLAVLYQPSISDLHAKFSSHLPEGRKVREIIGSLENPPPGDGGADQESPDSTHIRSDNDLDAFLRLTQASPVRLLIILHKIAADGANTPPPTGSSSRYYFHLGRFDKSQCYIDEVEDSDEEVTKRAGGGWKKGVPRWDHKFEKRLEEIRRRIRRQQRLLASLEEKHKAAFPTSIHDTDPGGELRMLCYGPNDTLSGEQVVKFRQVVSDYVADVAARIAANYVAGGRLTDAQIKSAAKDKVIQDINRGVIYANLNLPETIQ